MEYMRVMGLLHPKSLTRSQKKGALREINIIKEKWSEKFKGKKCADVQPQRCYINKEDASPPNIYLGAFVQHIHD